MYIEQIIVVLHAAIQKNQISLYSLCSPEAFNQWRGPSSHLNARATQLLTFLQSYVQFDRPWEQTSELSIG